MFVHNGSLLPPLRSIIKKINSVLRETVLELDWMFVTTFKANRLKVRQPVRDQQEYFSVPTYRYSRHSLKMSRSQVTVLYSRLEDDRNSLVMTRSWAPVRFMKGVKYKSSALNTPKSACSLNSFSKHRNLQCKKHKKLMQRTTKLKICRYKIISSFRYTQKSKNYLFYRSA